MPSSGSGAPSADESFAPPTPACAGAAGTKTATGTSAWPPQPSFRHAFTRRYALDTLASLAGFAFPLGSASSPLAVRARGPRAARRLQQLERPTSTTSCSPDPGFTVASHRSLGDGAANGVANWVLPAQGFVDRRSDLGTPHLCIRMRGGLTPTRRNPDTSCRSPMRPASGKTKRSATVRITGPFRSTRNRWEDRIARRAVLREARPAMRAAFRRRSRKEPAWTAPEVPSISETW